MTEGPQPKGRHPLQSTNEGAKAKGEVAMDSERTPGLRHLHFLHPIPTSQLKSTSLQ